MCAGKNMCLYLLSKFQSGSPLEKYRRSLQKSDPFHDSSRHNALRHQICLGAHQHLVHHSWCVLVNLLTRHGVTTEHEHQRTSCCMGCLKIKYQKPNIIYINLSCIMGHFSILKNARFEVFIFRQNWMTPYSKWWHSIPSCPRPASIAARFWRTPGPDGREGGHKRLDFPQEDCISTRQAMDNTSCNIAIIAHSECQTLAFWQPRWP